MNKLKILFCLLAVTVTLELKGQSIFILKGKIEGINNGNMKLILPPFDSTGFKEIQVPIKQGKFFFSGLFYYPFATFLVFNDSVRSNIFFIDKGLQNIQLSKNKFSIAVPNNSSRTNQQYKDFYKRYITPSDLLYDSLDTRFNEMRHVYNNNIPSHINDSLLNIRNDIKGKKEMALIDFIALKSDSYIALWHLYYRLNIHGDRKNFDNAFSLLNTKLKRTYVGKVIEKQLSTLKLTATGNIFPSLILADTNNNKISLKVNPTKKFTLVDFWFSSCKPCIKQFETLKEFYRLYNDKGFDIIGIATDQTQYIADWKEAIKKHIITWAQYLDENERNATMLAIQSYPTNFLLDENGKVLLKDISLNKLMKLLKSELTN